MYKRGEGMALNPLPKTSIFRVLRYRFLIPLLHFREKDLTLLTWFIFWVLSSFPASIYLHVQCSLGIVEPVYSVLLNANRLPALIFPAIGGHTVGVTHCFFFQDRLYNFQNTGRPDPNMDRELVKTLRLSCPQTSSGSNIVNLDQNPSSSSTVDNSYYTEIKEHRGVLQIDQALALDPETSDTVTSIARGSDFSTKFGQAMVKLGAIQVLTGTQGEIRKSCRATNIPPS